MTADERNALFERLITLQDVKIDHAIERGRDYLINRLQDCRQRTDEVGQITVRVKRALFEAKVARRNAKAVAKLDPKRADDYQASEDSYDELKALEEACNVTRSTLRAADSDIRLAGTLLGIQIGLGQFRPGEDPAGSVPSPSDAVPVERSAPAPTHDSAGIDLVGLIAPDSTIDPRDATKVPPPSSTPPRQAPKGAGADTRPASTTTIDEDPGFNLDDLIT